MANIEHRSIDSVLQAFDFFEKPNFAIYHGSEQRAYYDAGNGDDAKSKLTEWLNMIQQNGTNAVYTLKVYKEGATDITNKTPHSGSTTFQLQSNSPVRTENGIMILDNSRQPGTQVQKTGTDSAVTARLDKLEENNRQLQQQLYQAQLKNIEQNFEHRIAGLTQVQEEKTVGDRIGELLERKPEIVDRFLGLVERLTDKFLNTKTDYTSRPPAGAGVNGTKNTGMDNTEDTDQMTLEDLLNEDGSMINPLLTPDEAKGKNSAKQKLMAAKLQAFQQEQMDELQTLCLEVLDKRITPQVLTRVLITVACMDNEDLNKLLNHLD